MGGDARDGVMADTRAIAAVTSGPAAVLCLDESAIGHSYQLHASRPGAALNERVTRLGLRAERRYYRRLLAEWGIRWLKRHNPVAPRVKCVVSSPAGLPRSMWSRN